MDLLLAGLRAIGYQPGAVLRPTLSDGKRRRVRQLSSVEIDELVAAYRAGSSAEVLADQFVIHRTTVLLHLERRGVPRRVNKRKMNDEQAEEARQLRHLGVSYNELGRRYRVSADTVKREITKK